MPYMDGMGNYCHLPLDILRWTPPREATERWVKFMDTRRMWGALKDALPEVDADWGFKLP